MFSRLENGANELVRRDPNDGTPLRLLLGAQTSQGVVFEAEGRIPEALGKFRESIQSSLRIAESDPLNPDGVCMAVYSRAKYGEVLIQNTNRITEAQAELNEALRLSNQIASDNLTCLDQRKLTVINLARVAEKKGDWAAGMEWRRETVRTARRYAAQAPGEPLGMIIEAGASVELGLGVLKAIEHGEDRAALLEEARQALWRSIEIYQHLAAMGNPLDYQYEGFPSQASGPLNRVEKLLQK